MWHIYPWLYNVTLCHEILPMACEWDHVGNCSIRLILPNLYEVVKDSWSQDAQVASMTT